MSQQPRYQVILADLTADDVSILQWVAEYARQHGASAHRIAKPGEKFPGPALTSRVFAAIQREAARVAADGRARREMRYAREREQRRMRRARKSA